MNKTGFERAMDIIAGNDRERQKVEGGDRAKWERIKTELLDIERNEERKGRGRTRKWGVLEWRAGFEKCTMEEGAEVIGMTEETVTVLMETESGALIELKYWKEA